MNLLFSTVGPWNLTGIFDMVKHGERNAGAQTIVGIRASQRERQSDAGQEVPEVQAVSKGLQDSFSLEMFASIGLTSLKTWAVFQRETVSHRMHS